MFENWGEIPLLIDIVNRKLSKMFLRLTCELREPGAGHFKISSQSDEMPDANCIKMLVRPPIATVTSGHLGGE